MYILFYFIGFLSLSIYSLSQDNKYVFRALISLPIFLIIMITISQEVGGDLARYERYFYGIKIGDVLLNQWVDDHLKLIIKWIFNETTYASMPLQREPNYDYSIQIYNQIDHFGFKFYQIITNLVYIAGAFSLVNSVSYRNSNITKFLILLLPITMTFMTSSIEQSLSLGIVFFALSRIQKNKLYFLLLILLSAFIHWSSWMFLPLVFYDRRFFMIFLFVSLACILILEIWNFDLVNIFINTITTTANRFDTDIFDIFINNIKAAEKVNRSISWHHIYLSSFFVFCAVVFYMKFGSSLNPNKRKDYILLISTLMLLLLVSFLFKNIDTYIVRLGSAMKIIALICFVNVAYMINRYTRQINLLLGLNLALLGVYSFY